MSTKTPITTAEAIGLMQSDPSLSFADISEVFVFVPANVPAADPTPEPEVVNAALVAHITALWEAGTARADTKGNRDGTNVRVKRTLGVTDHIDGFRVVITQPKS